MNRFSRYAKEGSAVYKAPCGKSILESNGGNELKEHIENCIFCKKEMRKTGFYWVQYANGNWTICEWDGVQWNHKGCSYPDKSWKNIDERQIIRSEN
jgi:hypothetical protein